MALNTRHLGASLAVGALTALLASGCGVSPVSPRPTGRAPTSSETAAAARRVAERFMGQLERADYRAQWSELAPLAREQWPDQAARSRMLARKFSGAARVKGFTLGRVTRGVSWVSREDPLQTSHGDLAVPVSVRFAAPAAIQPARVAALYSSMTLVLRVSGPSGRLAASVLGEGPASLDAPVIVPPSPEERTAQVPILMYHVVNQLPLRAQWDNEYAYLLEYGLTVTPAQFAQQMAYLVAQRAHAISLNRVADYLLYGLSLPSNPVVLTFDDGRLSPLANSVPILLRDGFTATFFVPSGLVGKTVHSLSGLNPQHYLSWAELTQMSAEGLWIEDHTVDDNTDLWGLSNSEVAQLAGVSAQTLEQHTHVPVQYIAYSGVWPYPSPAQAGPAQRRMFSQLAALGYVAGTIDGRTDSDLQETSLLWQLARIRMNPNQPLSALQRWVS